MYDYGIIGNCQGSALVSSRGSVDWYCLPRPDSPPVFGRLLDERGGRFVIEPGEPGFTSKQHYHSNTNVLETIFDDGAGNVFSVTDFFPRFEQHGRIYRPLMMVRIVTPISGMPLIRAECQPVLGWLKTAARPRRGNSHVDYLGYDDLLRLTTSIPLIHLLEGTSMTLTEPHYFFLSWGPPVEENLAEIAHSFLRRTVEWWRTWVKRSSIPVLFQKEVIRSALVLKLHCFEETGAILASMTTSLPENPGEERNWDYRFCWLRDAYFTISAFYRLGHFEELEAIISYVLDLMNREDLKRLKPVYRIDGHSPLPERSRSHWCGFASSTPVRDGNQAGEHIQNDVYGEMLLTMGRIYFDERFSHLRSEKYDLLLRTLAERCHDVLGEADAGLWELRQGWQAHSFSALMSWAGLDCFSRLVSLGKVSFDTTKVLQWRQRAHDCVMSAVEDGILRTSVGNRMNDSSLLLLANLRFPERAVVEKTVEAISRTLRMEIAGRKTGFMYRYLYEDDFGRPRHAFVICSFWLAEALARLGRREEATEVFTDACTAANGLGIFSEHFDPIARCQWGNYPQCYSHVGLIQAAFSVSPGWHTVF